MFESASLPLDHGRPINDKRAKLEGIVTSVIFRNEEDDWSVIAVVAKGKKHRVTGHTAVQEGQEVVAEGIWTEKVIKGTTEISLKADKIIAVTPRSAKGIANYLSANVKGIGPVLASRVAKHFGEDLFQVLEETPEILSEVKGMNESKVRAIAAAWKEQKAVAEIMLFLHDQDLSASLCKRIFKAYGDKAREVITDNPYLLSQDIRGIGFLKADEIAAKLKIPRTSPFRLKAGLSHVIEQAKGNGHCGLNIDEFVRLSVEALGVPLGTIQVALRDLLKEEKSPLVFEHDAIWSSRLFFAEKEISQQIRERVSRPPAFANKLRDVERAVRDVEGRVGIELAPAQRQAALMALRSGFSIITGGPGCGKTTTLNVILRVFRDHKLSVKLAAPTGKAAQRAAEATGEEASTLHRLMKISSEDSGATVTSDVLVIDEASMIDVPLMRAVLMGASSKTAILVVGDVDQLPSVGPGRVLGDMIESGAIPVTRLTTVYRQGKGSLIIENAHEVNAGRMPKFQRNDGDFFFINESDPRLADALKREEPGVLAQTAQEILIELVQRRLPARYGFNPLRDIMVLAPMNSGRCGVKNLNEQLQKTLNPEGEKVGVFGFKVGDRVIQTRNNYDLNVFNGDQGFILGADKQNQLLKVGFESREVDYPFEELDSLRLAYAITIHKSQGSQAPCVVIPVLTEHFALLQRNLIYTGITRAQKLCVVVGTHKAMSIAVRKVDSQSRKTLLKYLLQARKPD